MTSRELREKFLSFFEKNGHKIVPSSSLLPSDPTVLFTTAGMQQFKPYYLGEKSLFGKNAASCQKCLRISDIDEVGDERHLTFFEMLGNFSFGGYQKEEAIKLAKEFLDSVGIKIDYVTVFSGDKEVLRDEESAKIWQKLGFSEEKGTLRFCGREDNFWGPTGEEGPCGPTTEIYSQDIEVWNIVFNQYYCHKDKSLTELPLFGVDTGMGLERLAKVSQNVPTVFETDLFGLIMKEIKGDDLKTKRIIADHAKSAVFLASEGILPSNLERGYILRRLIRRGIRYGKLLNLSHDFLIPLAKKVIEIYKDIYPEVLSKEDEIIGIIRGEEEKFEKTLEQGLKEFKDYVLRKEPKGGHAGVARDQMILDGKEAFYLYQTFGFPKEIMQELCKEENIKFDERGFEEELKKHQELSRTASAGMFKGGLVDSGEQAVKYHTANHLLLAALRQVLGSHVLQRGSNITEERLRFDFSHPDKMTEEEIKKVEDIVNQKIKEGLPVVCEEMAFNKAKEVGAMGVFESKYGEKVKVYTVGDFSKEICGGPHVNNTSELGHFKIVKEESSSSGIRRIRAILE
ncbi:MAG: alanine--tRNA ligase [Candidatus Paceibacterota bacterium]